MPQRKIDSREINITDLFSASNFYVVPDFQREYVWDNDHVDKLLTDIEDALYDENGKFLEDSEYFLGTIVVADENGKQEIIDGQQRITALFLILCAARDILKDAGEDLQSLETKISDVKGDSETGKDIRKARLQLQYEDSGNILTQAVEGKLYHTDPTDSKSSESQKKMYSAYKFALTYLQDTIAKGKDDKSKAKSISKFIINLTDRTNVVSVVTLDRNTAFKVFETINNRGVGLTPMDLLKNKLFIEAKKDKHQKIKDKWRDLIRCLEETDIRRQPVKFLRYYILANYHGSLPKKDSKKSTKKAPKEDSVYAWIEENSEGIGLKDNPLKFLDSLLKGAEVYRNFCEYKDAKGDDVKFLRNIRLLGGPSFRLHYIVLLAAQSMRGSLFSQLCEALENSVFCRFIAGEAAKVTEQQFIRWASEVREIKNDEEKFNKFIKDVQTETENIYDDFSYKFLRITEENLRAYRIKYILAKISQNIVAKALHHGEHQDLDYYFQPTIHLEHILPRTKSNDVLSAFNKPEEYDSYVKKLGNLTLLEGVINTVVSNETFDNKKIEYKKSQIPLTSSIAEINSIGDNTSYNRAVECLKPFTKWDSESIDERQKMLFDLAHEVWNIPK